MCSPAVQPLGGGGGGGLAKATGGFYLPRLIVFSCLFSPPHILFSFLVLLWAVFAPSACDAPHQAVGRGVGRKKGQEEKLPRKKFSSSLCRVVLKGEAVICSG